LVPLLAVVGLAAAACSSSSSSGAATASPTTAAANPAPYAKAGPYAVGFTRLHLAGGRNVVVWYPAQPGASSGHKQETIDIAGMLTPELQAKVPAADRVLYHANAYENASAASTPGNYPLVVFSHGFAGYPEQSVALTTHLASWGFVVAAPDHVERSLDGLLGTATNGVPQSTDLAVLQSTVDLVERASKTTGVLQGLVDPNRVVAAGHSAGAGAAYQFAGADSRVKAWISYSVGTGIGAFATKAPTKPGMVMLGTTDGIIAPAKSVQVYNGMHSPKYLVKISHAGHLVFSDICLIARDKGGITGIAKAIKLPIPASLLKLGSDGCESPHPLVSSAFPAIDQLSVAFFRSALGIDPQPVGLDSAAVANLGADVSVASQP
jgi:predicted dienelactone hydrolase